MSHDLASVLIYKLGFFGTRSTNAVNQAREGQTCTAMANAGRVAVTTSQAMVPLFAVAATLATTAKNPTLRNTANKIASSRLKDIAATLTSSTTKDSTMFIAKASKFLARLGVAGNIAYAAAKPLDADEKDKSKVFVAATGNIVGMYTAEHIYSKVIAKIKPKDAAEVTVAASKKINPKSIAELCKKIKLRNIKGSSILIGIGFVAASLAGCKAGEKIGELVYKGSKTEKFQQEKQNLLAKTDNPLSLQSNIPTTA
ncbi:MAG: hypothetical protein PHX18_07095 [Candidatus Gastranaerophilales bacterium]|nr:hypothetical protein [Candidatus Gastranaerophilales bacterium]